MADGSPQGGNRGDAAAGPKLFLPACVVCAKGRVLYSTDPDAADTYSCTHCSSRIVETILGYVFKEVDAGYLDKADDLKKRTFTKPQLVHLATQTVRLGHSALVDRPADKAGAEAVPTRKPRPADAATAPRPAAPPKPAPRPKQESVPSGDALLKELVSDESPKPAADDDLWWEIDVEEVARRKADKARAKAPPGPEPSQKPDGVSIDDLLDELDK